MDKLMEQNILEEYCSNEMKKLKQLCNPIISRKCVPQMYWDDLYSAAMDTLVDSIERYDDSKECLFKSFLTGNIMRTFYDWTRDNHRGKRCNLQRDSDGRISRDENNNIIVIPNISIDASFDEGINLIEKIDSGFQIEKELSDEFSISLDDKVEKYLNRLSKIQRKIVMLLADGYLQDEIGELLHITKIEYADNMIGIKAHENVRILY